MNIHNGLRAAGLALAVTVLMGTSASMSTSDFRSGRINYLTFSGPVALPGVILPAGSYIFDLGPSNVVMVSTRDGQNVLFSGLTQMVLRPAGLSMDTTVTFGEGAGAPPITAWYPVGANVGFQFIY